MAEVAAEELVERARLIADEVLFPIAQDVDRSPRVPASSLRVLAEAGLFGIAGGAEQGGIGGDRRAAWRISALIGGGCAATFFVWAQHHTAVRVLRSSPNTSLVESLLDDLCAGERLAGVAFAHLRRTGPPAIRATRVEGGWQVDGFSPWTTSWGVADHFAVAAESDDGEVVWVMLPGRASEGMTATPLQLPVLMSTGTVALRFDRCIVPDDRVALIESAEHWRARDRVQAASGNPVTIGIARRAARLLAEIGEQDPLAAVAASRIDEECARRECVFDELLDTMEPGDEYVARASDHRAACIGLAQRATTALLAATGGRGMDLAHPAQRLAREAGFFVIQAQTVDGRAAALRAT